MNDMTDPTSNLRRLIVLSYGSPRIDKTTWKRLHAEGWEWHANIETADYEAAHHFIKVVQDDHGKGNISVGSPWDIDRNAPSDRSNALCGVYVRDVKRLVFSLHRDLANWERLTEEELDDL